MAVAVGLLNTLTTGAPMAAPVPDPGRANVIGCANYLPGDPKVAGGRPIRVAAGSRLAATDPAG